MVRFPVAACMLVMATAVLAAQSPQQTPTQTFRARTDYVYTDVTVRDAAGRPVPNLTVSDFEVFEDGVRQTVTSFAAMVGGRATTDITPAAAPAREGLIMPATARPPEQGRIFIIFIDDLHIQFLETARTKKILEQIRDTLVHDGDLVGLVSSGYSSVATDVSPDPNHLRFNDAIRKTLGAGKDPREVIHAMETRDGPSGLRQNAMVAFKTVYDILAQAEQVTNRRKAFIYISSGYDFNPFTDARYKAAMEYYGAPPIPVESGVPNRGGDPISGLAGSAGQLARNPFEMNGLQFANVDLLSAIGELISRARRANVAFYPIDPRGLNAGPDIASNLSNEDWTKYLNNSLSTLDAIAGGTGGFCLCRNNDVRRGLQRIDNDLSDYYVIGYESTNPDPRKDTRRIEIKVKRPGVTEVVYKNQYSLRKK